MLALLTLTSIILWNLKIDYLFSIIPLITGLSFVFLFSLFKNHAWLNSRLIGKIGIYSYGMYITHFLFAWYIPQYILFPSLKNVLNPDLIYFISFVLAVSCSYFLSSVLHRVIEAPLVRLGNAFINKKI